MRVVSAPVIKRSANGCGLQSSWDLIQQHPSSPKHSAAANPCPFFQGLAACYPAQLGHPQKPPSAPFMMQQIEEDHTLRSADGDFASPVSDPSLLQLSAQSQTLSSAKAPRCCTTCTGWKCTFGCWAGQPRDGESQAQCLRICWGRMPLVTGGGVTPQHECRPNQQQQHHQEQHHQERPQQQSQVMGDDQKHEAQRYLEASHVMADSPSASSTSRMQLHLEGASGFRCAFRAAGVSALTCVSCKGVHPTLFSYEEAVHLGDTVSQDLELGEDSEPLQPHLRLSRPSSGLHGLESCAAATNAAAMAAAAAAGVAKAVRREAVARVSGHHGFPLENVPHFHLRSPVQSGCSINLAGRSCNIETEGGTAASNDSRAEIDRCCIAVVDWLTAELFEARVALLLQGCAWLDFARLSPLQRALRSVVVKLMEEDPAVRLIRDVMWVLDPQQTGSVSSEPHIWKGWVITTCLHYS